MAQQLLCHLQVARLRVYEARSRVPESVKPGSSRRPGNAQPVERRIEHVLAEDIRIQSRSISFAKDEVLWFDIYGAPVMLQQWPRQSVPERNCTNTAGRLRRHQLPLPQALLDSQRPIIQVDVLPLQAQ